MIYFAQARQVDGAPIKIGTTDAQLAAIRAANESLRFRLVVVGREEPLRMSWDEAADAVDRTHTLLAEIERLRGELAAIREPIRLPLCD